jgi:hypothetical protein
LLAGLLVATGVYPLVRALQANRRTTLRQPLLWALTAWAAWTGVAWSRVLHASAENERLACYGALCLTGCAGVAVLGARRPGVAAWNFVVVGLLAVLLLPILNGLGELRLEPAQELFLGATLLVPLLNYLPTRLGPGMLLTAAGCGLTFIRLIAPDSPPWMRPAGLGLLAGGSWVAWIGVKSQRLPDIEFDRLWLAYRDRFGFVWGQRMREQFNQAVRHAGHPVVLRWDGLHPTASQPLPEPAVLLLLLRAVLKRFGAEEKQPPTKPR